MGVTVSSYSTDVEGGAPVALRYVIRGRLDLPVYLAFVDERAHWLAIDGWVRATADGVELVAAGPEALVGALEMACTLGPLDMRIDSIAAVAEMDPVGAGFHVAG